MTTHRPSPALRVVALLLSCAVGLCAAVTAGGCGGKQDGSAGGRPGAGGKSRAGGPAAGRLHTFAGVDFVLIPPGEFTMGSPESEPGRRPSEQQCRVTLTRAYYLALDEVTQALWATVMDTVPARTRDDALPVESVSWHDAIRFCNALSERAGLQPAYLIDGLEVAWDRDADGFRLPTEAEWERACRAGAVSPFHTGACLTDAQANYNALGPLPGCPEGGFRNALLPVGSFPPNAWGLRDMHGNVAEWCWDWYEPFAAGPAVDPAGPAEGHHRALRGGDAAATADRCRCAARGATFPVHQMPNVGLRLARNGPRS